jgi:hypothetical protein
MIRFVYITSKSALRIGTELRRNTPDKVPCGAGRRNHWKGDRVSVCALPRGDIGVCFGGYPK